MTVAPHLVSVFEALLAAHPVGARVTLDEISAAIGVLPAGSDQIEALFVALEEKGRVVIDANPNPSAQAEFLQVTEAIKLMNKKHNRRPTIDEIAVVVRLSPGRVREILALGSLIGRTGREIPKLPIPTKHALWSDDGLIWGYVQMNFSAKVDGLRRPNDHAYIEQKCRLREKIPTTGFHFCQICEPTEEPREPIK